MSEARVCDHCKKLIKGRYYSIEYMVGDSRLETLQSGYPRDFHVPCLKEWVNETINQESGV